MREAHASVVCGCKHRKQRQGLLSRKVLTLNAQLTSPFAIVRASTTAACNEYPMVVCWGGRAEVCMWVIDSRSTCRSWGCRGPCGRVGRLHDIWRASVPDLGIMLHMRMLSLALAIPVIRTFQRPDATYSSMIVEGWQ